MLAYRNNIATGQQTGVTLPPVPKDFYSSFAELQRYECEGRDYAIRSRLGQSGILIMAPHGGSIEPGTAEIAKALAFPEHSFYAFLGLDDPARAQRLHLTSTSFDEPRALALIANSTTVITIHGCLERNRMVYLGGRDETLKQRLITALSQAGFAVADNHPHPSFGGRHADNICNKGRSAKGIQVEIALGLRELLLAERAASPEQGLFGQFIQAFRGGIA